MIGKNLTVHFLEVCDEVTQLVGSYDMRNPTKSAPRSNETETKSPEGVIG